MRATVDANILFAALLKSGTTRKLWFGPEIELYAPSFLLKEFKKYADYLKRKFAGSEEEFQKLYNKITAQIFLVEDSELKPFLPAAASLIKDPDDWLYLACALKEDTVIWSEDRGFKAQNRIKTLNTKEMVKEFGIL